MALFWFDDSGPTYGRFSVMKLKNQKAKKAVSKAELAFAYKMQNCSAQKVVYWVVLLLENIEL